MADHPMTPAFREAFRCHPAGVAVITADPGAGPVALTVSSLISISASPPVVGLSMSAKSASAAALLEAGTMVIHLLRFGDLDLAILGATPGADRFGPDIGWERLPTGEPRYTAVETWFRAKIVGTMALEGATVVVAELLHGKVSATADSPETQSLIYLDRRWHRLREDLQSLRTPSLHLATEDDGTSVWI